MPFKKLAFELHKMKISDNPIEEFRIHDSVTEASEGPKTHLKESGVKKNQMKQKSLLRKPRFNYLYGKTRAEGLEWVHKNVGIGEEEESNWVKKPGSKTVSCKAYEMKAFIAECENVNQCLDSDSGKEIGLKNLNEWKSQTKVNKIPSVSQVVGSEDAYDVKDLISECEKLEDVLFYEIRGDQFQNQDEENVNELACYLDNMAIIPKKMSPMVDMIYS
ncbi:uncharacterized protein LOC108049478 [Drosophila rhopaloa]|uniref:Uncharacterized protein LOC108049478 n=1 Tax=Drosophila rhopaloa TaxID=1041015 RepID=A0A6P4F7A0_DRORH|nr:uncharacterized protein LOC108049478 [Drosophila rhopaloa]